MHVPLLQVIAGVREKLHFALFFPACLVIVKMEILRFGCRKYKILDEQRTCRRNVSTDETRSLHFSGAMCNLLRYKFSVCRLFARRVSLLLSSVLLCTR